MPGQQGAYFDQVLLGLIDRLVEQDIVVTELGDALQTGGGLRGTAQQIE